MLPHEKEQEREAFRQMPFSKKVQHFLTYYYIQTIAVATGIGILIYLLYRVFFVKPDTYLLAGAVFDDHLNPTRTELLTEDLKELCGATSAHEFVRIDDTYSSYSTQDQIRISVLTTAGEYDFIVAGREMFASLAGTGYFEDLEDFLGEEEQEAFGEALTFFPGRGEEEEVEDPLEISGRGEVRPYGLSLSGSALWRSLEGEEEEPYLGVVASAPNEENLHLFLRTLFAGADDPVR